MSDHLNLDTDFLDNSQTSLESKNGHSTPNKGGEEKIEW